jgi:hypothetical protein
VPIIAGKKQPSPYQTLFGTEKSRFAEGIKRRREGSENVDPSEYFFDPTSAELSAPMGMMTRYLSKGVPNVSRRVAGTMDFMKKMRALGPSAEEASTLFAERYPRIAAHMDIQKMPKILESKGSGLTRVGERSRGAFPEQTPVMLRDIASSRGGPPIENTLLHEGTHVAQDLGNKNTLPMYHTATDALASRGFTDWESYITNPFETSARTAASRKMGEKLAPESALRGIDTIVKNLPAGDPNRIKLGSLRRSVGPTIEAAKELSNPVKSKLFK